MEQASTEIIHCQEPDPPDPDGNICRPSHRDLIMKLSLVLSRSLRCLRMIPLNIIEALDFNG